MKKRRYSSPYLSRDYFSKDILPHTVYAGRKTIRQQIPYRQHDEIQFLLVRSGHSTVTINARTYPVQRGSLLCFSPNHFHKLDLGKGSYLDISECHMNAGVYFYISACPYYHGTDAQMPMPPVYAQLNEACTQQVTLLMEQIAVECEKGPVSENQPLFFLLMKLFGFLEKYAAPEE